ncbi:hypothetical protein BH18CHL2_BH18CHL2_12740 [soil metagenome]
MTAPLDPERVARHLEAGATLIEAELGALGDDASWHPAAGEWCANEIIGHIVEAERRGFAGRIAHFVREEHPRTEAWDQLAVARARGDCERAAQALLAEFSEARRASAALVRSLRPEQLERSGTHPKVGELRVRDLLHEWVHHDRNHTKQLLAIAQERVWPHMGNSQRFAGE